ncbi:MAG: outer membrane beta-barrel protein [Candidatus Ornithospirochaeta sp.]|nr:outer membrane beta-barrel protein [Candidatus Ornithospirochaeta sp.]
MRKTIVALMLLFLSSMAYASDSPWSIGISSGYSNAAVLQNEGYRIDTDYISGHGFSISVPVRYDVNGYFAVETGLTYIQKNFRLRKIGRESTSSFTMTQDQINGFVEIPLSCCFSISNGMASATASLGPYIGIWAHSYRVEKPYNSSKGLGGEGSGDIAAGFHSFTNADNRFEFGFLFSAGMEFDFTSSILFIRGMYDISVTDLAASYQIDQVESHNSTFRVEAGLRLPIGGRR